MNQIIASQHTHHISPSRVSYGVSVVRIFEKIDCVIMAPYCSCLQPLVRPFTGTLLVVLWATFGLLIYHMLLYQLIFVCVLNNLFVKHSRIIVEFSKGMVCRTFQNMQWELDKGGLCSRKCPCLKSLCPLEWAVGGPGQGGLKGVSGQSPPFWEASDVTYNSVSGLAGQFMCS